MPSATTAASAAAIFVLASLVSFVRVPLTLGFGWGKTIQPLSHFPYQCRRLTSSRLQGCEDMWLSESSRQLFLACSEPAARKQWLPAMGHLNVSGRSLTDAIIALDIDKPHLDSFTYRVLTTPGFDGTAGDGNLYALALTGIQDGDDIKLFVTNDRPSVDSEGKLLDQTAVGANATIEIFTTGPAATELKHVRTLAHSRISTPNNLAPMPNWGDEGVFITNDHGNNKVGLAHKISPFIGTGNVVFCNPAGCKTVASGFKFPNGVLRGNDGLLYVVTSVEGGVTVYKILDDHSLEKVDYINVDYGMDNLVQDTNGDIFAAAFPKTFEATAAAADPINVKSTTAVIRIRRGEKGYIWDKVLEDGEKEILSQTTAVVHDAKTGRLFLSSVISPFITVCDPK